MRRDIPVLRRLVKVSAVVLGAGLVVTACSSSPVKFGIGRDRRRPADHARDAGQRGHQPQPGRRAVQEHRAAEPGAADAADAHLADPVQGQRGARPPGRHHGHQCPGGRGAGDDLRGGQGQRGAAGIPNPSLDLILAANGIPPNLAHEVGRYQAINDEFAKQANGGQTPTSTSAQTATSAKLTKAQCQAAKALNIQVNPQFGQLNSDQLAIVARPARCSGPPGGRRRPLPRG